jgi:hypothetical protein
MPNKAWIGAEIETERTERLFSFVANVVLQFEQFFCHFGRIVQAAQAIFVLNSRTPALVKVLNVFNRHN